MEPLQVLLRSHRGPELIAGLPVALRAVQRAAELRPGRIVLAGQDAAFTKLWSRQLASFDDCPVVFETPSRWAPRPVLVLSSAGLPRPGRLKAFLKEAAARGGRVAWNSGGTAVALYDPSGADASLEGADSELPLDGWDDSTPAGLAAAESALWASLGHEKDGYIARLDRALSGALSRLLVKTPVTPNQITSASLLLGLAGAVLVATGIYRWQLLGGSLWWLCCILDGCDGEVARVKLLCSKAGAAYDVAADNVAHLATFAGIAAGVYRAGAGPGALWAGLLLVSGVAASMFSVWWLILRRPDEPRSELERCVERVASRDYVYLLVALIALGKLHWFFWAAAFGSHAFNAALWIMARSTRRATSAAAAALLALALPATAQMPARAPAVPGRPVAVQTAGIESAASKSFESEAVRLAQSGADFSAIFQGLCRKLRAEPKAKARDLFSGLSRWTKNGAAPAIQGRADWALHFIEAGRLSAHFGRTAADAAAYAKEEFDAFAKDNAFDLDDYAISVAGSRWAWRADEADWIKAWAEGARTLAALPPLSLGKLPPRRLPSPKQAADARMYARRNL